MASKFIEEIRRHMRMRGYSLKTEKAYIYWIKYFIRFNKLKHPQDMGTTEVTAYLSYLANEQHVAINTQKVALNAIAFLYNQFLQRPLGDLGFTYAKKQRKVPSVLTPNEVQLILSHLSGVNHSIFSLLYGSGLRVNECLRIRVQDHDLQNLSLTVRDGKGMSLTTEAFLISLPIAVFCKVFFGCWFCHLGRKLPRSIYKYYWRLFGVDSLLPGKKAFGT